MGAGIALCAARVGWSVDLVEVDAAIRARAPELLKKEARRGACEDAVKSIRLLDSIARCAASGIAIEAVTEQFDIKESVFAELAHHLEPDAILATNTSSLPIASLADSVWNPERVIGLHFFNPPLLMKLVEIVRTEKTQPLVAERAAAFVGDLGKTGVLTGDAPGFIVNRVARPFYLQALHALERGTASIQDMDALARGAGFRMGPFELMDLIGLDVNLATSESIYERTGFPRLAPVEIQRMMVAQNNLGRKTNKGFYTYSNGARPAAATSADSSAAEDRPKNTDETVLIVGANERAHQFCEIAQRAYGSVRLIEDDRSIAGIHPAASLVIDVPLSYNGARLDVWRALDSAIGEDAIVCVDAYAVDFRRLAASVSRPERFVGFGVLGSLAQQSVVEIVNAKWSSAQALVVLENFFALGGKQTRRVAHAPGLYLGSTVCSIINEACYAFAEGVASKGDIETAMKLGTNYPKGPFAWAAEIGAARVAGILDDVARKRGLSFASAPLLAMLEQP